MAESRREVDELFSAPTLIGPEDRPRGEWELVMVEWRAFANTALTEYLGEMDGAPIRAVQCAARQPEGRIYLRTCSPDAEKAHTVSLNANHRSSSFSLYTPLLAFDFPRVGKGYKAIFRCTPETYGDAKILVVDVKNYRIERLDRATRAEAEATRKREEAAAGTEAKP